MGAIGDILKRASGKEIRGELNIRLYFFSETHREEKYTETYRDYKYTIWSQGLYPVVNLYSPTGSLITYYSFNKPGDYILGKPEEGLKKWTVLEIDKKMKYYIESITR